MKNCNIGDCSGFNWGSELYKVMGCNPDGTCVVEYYRISDEGFVKETWDDVEQECLDGNFPITSEQFEKVAAAYRAVYDAALEITRSLPEDEAMLPSFLQHYRITLEIHAPKPGAFSLSFELQRTFSSFNCGSFASTKRTEPTWAENPGLERSSQGSHTR